jgi:tRNA(Leu) C34 or U34 (ribose-2'-O)-methylase TrmL
VFGPEDGHVPKGVRGACHRFVTIPSDGCLNLAAAVNVVLYDRMAKARQYEVLAALAPGATADLSKSRSLG